MNCNGFRKNINRYFDDELNEEKRAAFEEHMKNCPTCRNLFEEMRLSCLAVRNLKETDAPSNLKDLVMARINSESPAKHVTNENLNKFRWMTAAAASFILVITLTLYFNRLPLNNTTNPAQKDQNKIKSEVTIRQDSDMKENNMTSTPYVYTPVQDSRIGETNYPPEVKSKIISIELIFNKKLSEIDVESLINQPELRNIKHRIEENDDIITVVFEKNPDGNDSDMNELYKFLINKYNAEISNANSETDEEIYRIRLVVNYK